MVDEDEAKAVDMEMVDVVIVIFIEVIMKLTVVIEMMLNKEFDVEVDKEVTKEVFMVLMCKNVSCWKQNWVQFRYDMFELTKKGKVGFSCLSRSTLDLIRSVQRWQ